jgi:hypothetical protein
MSDRLNSNSTLGSGQSLTSGSYKLKMELGGNLVFSGPNGTLWQSFTGGNAGAMCSMRSGGNLIVHLPPTNNDTPLWETRTSGNAGAYLIVKSYGEAIVYDSSGTRKLWSTNTAFAASALQATQRARAAIEHVHRELDAAEQDILAALMGPAPRVGDGVREVSGPVTYRDEMHVVVNGS